MNSSTRHTEAEVNKFTVLFVDDEPNILATINRMFRRSPYRILTAESGPAALVLMDREPVDILVTDHRMPGMTGAELCLQVMELYPLTVRIMLSAYAHASELIQAVDRGAVYRMLAKPNDIKHLRRVVDLSADQIRLIRCFQSVVKDLARRGENFTYLVDSTGATIRIGFPGNGSSLTREQAALVVDCLTERAGAEAMNLTGAVMTRERERLRVNIEFGQSRTLALEISLMGDEGETGHARRN